jgi:hypothetical protein
MIAGIVLPSDFAGSTPPSSAEPPFELSELDQNPSSPPLLFSAQDDSILVASGSSYTSISEQTTTPLRFLGGDLTAVRNRSSSYHF